MGPVDALLVDTLHHVPVEQLYLRELEFRRKLENVDTSTIPIAETNRVEVQTEEYCQRHNAFRCAFAIAPLRLPNEEFYMQPVAPREADYCKNLRNLFRDAEDHLASGHTPLPSTSRRFQKNIDRSPDNHQVMSFWQWFMTGPAWLPEMYIVIPRTSDSTL